MIGFIEYYYNFSNIESSKDAEGYHFYYNNESYTFTELTRGENEIIEIIDLTYDNPIVNKIIKNRYSKYITRIYNANYILVKNNGVFAINTLDYFKIIKKGEIQSLLLDKSNWVELWSKKIDIIEYQTSQVCKKYKTMKNICNYYIGMAETGLVYVRRTLDEMKHDYNKKVISHIRITDDNICDPQSIIIDYESRDIAEYLKYVYFNKNNDCMKLAKLILQNVYLDEFSLRLIYGRLFFPTFYFDIYDKINDYTAEELDKKIEKITRKTEGYENYINYVYSLIISQKKIPKISWI